MFSKIVLNKSLKKKKKKKMCKMRRDEGLYGLVDISRGMGGGELTKNMNEGK